MSYCPAASRGGLQPVHDSTASAWRELFSSPLWKPRTFSHGEQAFRPGRSDLNGSLNASFERHGLRRQTDAAENVFKPRIGAQRVETRLPFAVHKPSRTVSHGLVQPGKRGVLIAERGVDQGNVEGRGIGLRCSREESL